MKKAKYPHKLLNNKKAQTQESQLNWIFILIVGALIMAFFAFIVMKQKTASEAKFAGKVTEQLNTILVGAKVSSGTVQVIPTPDLDIRFTCNDYYIGPASQRLGNRVVFAPEFVVGNELITWARDWNVPFKVSTFLYMTTPYIKYVLVGPDETEETPITSARMLYDMLPDKLNKAYTTISELDNIPNENDKHVRFIFVNLDEPYKIPSSFIDSDKVSALAVSVLSSPSTVTFYRGDSSMNFVKYSDTAPPFKVLENEFLFGAIFSDKPDIYSCLTEKAYERLNVVAMVYKERLNKLAPSFKYQHCESLYKENPHLQMIIGATASSRVGIDTISYDTLSEAKESLVADNDRLQLWSCPLIY